MMRDFQQYLEIVRHHIVSALSKIGYLFFFFGASREDVFFQLSREEGFLFLLFARSAKIFFLTFRAKREEKFRIWGLRRQKP